MKVGMGQVFPIRSQLYIASVGRECQSAMTITEYAVAVNQ